LQLDEDVIRRAKVLAAKRGTSVSGLVAHEREELVPQNSRDGGAWPRATEIMRQSAPRGGRTWRRDELHER
jgi:hypothetical protein